MSATTPFPRHIAVLILATLACSFAGNHIAARIAFDHDAGLLLAMLCRSGVTLLALVALVLWRRESLKLSRHTWGWQILLGLLIAIQSFCIYSAVARIPVALALLVVNLAPILLALLTWALGGPRPTRRAARPRVPGAALWFGVFRAVHLRHTPEHRAQCTRDEHGARGGPGIWLADSRSTAWRHPDCRGPDRGHRYCPAGLPQGGLSMSRRPLAPLQACSVSASAASCA